MLTSLFAVASVLVGNSAPPTFSLDIAPLIYRHCSGCHQQGQIAPFPLVRYEDVSKRANQISDLVARREMPPWKPVPGHGEFQDSRFLNEEQIQKIKDWVLAGVPLGDSSNPPFEPSLKKGFQLGQPDLVWEIPEAFTVPPEGDDITMHFVLPLKKNQKKHLRALEVIPGNRRVVHHAMGFLDSSGSALKLSEFNGVKGFSRFGGIGFLPSGILPGFGPGLTPRFPDINAGWEIREGTDLVLQILYHPSGKLEKDQTKIGLYFLMLGGLKPPPLGGGFSRFCP